MNNLGNINNLDICQLNNSPCPCAAENKTNEIIDIDSPKLTQFLHISKFHAKKNNFAPFFCQSNVFFLLFYQIFG